ncbi:hypothetical protein INR49_022973 [Scomber scombrus]|uniref:Uncharacterized protein n=1 Tax=Scomber scombrus TaxID=13677 RepID=A0AAV1NHP0_SCOSC
MRLASPFCGLRTVSCRSRLGRLRDEERLSLSLPRKEKQVAVPFSSFFWLLEVGPLEMIGVCVWEHVCVWLRVDSVGIHLSSVVLPG